MYWHQQIRDNPALILSVDQNEVSSVDALVAVTSDPSLVLKLPEGLATLEVKLKAIEQEPGLVVQISESPGLSDDEVVDLWLEAAFCQADVLSELEAAGIPDHVKVRIYEQRCCTDGRNIEDVPETRITEALVLKAVYARQGGLLDRVNVSSQVLTFAVKDALIETEQYSIALDVARSLLGYTDLVGILKVKPALLHDLETGRRVNAKPFEVQCHNAGFDKLVLSPKEKNDLRVIAVARDRAAIGWIPEDELTQAMVSAAVAGNHESAASMPANRRVLSMLAHATTAREHFFFPGSLHDAIEWMISEDKSVMMLGLAVVGTYPLASVAELLRDEDPDFRKHLHLVFDEADLLRSFPEDDKLATELLINGFSL
ncbi:hypothetical protein HNP46_005735 [Pseudomonas nitritireducens]|uniref:Uncharacterized protein n=1 Tax=Pseudomonas nitroreducens TaxID=46680 RepID=A0A7W7P3B8_PSENT|nr:hypothetical protein [Pseudomonas nitritireducens]MBB4866828.1 hypothetical protein [Pseudomonas nitritireducens]